MAKAKRAHARRSRATKIGRGKRVRSKPKAKPHANSRTKPLPRPHGNRLVFSPELIADGKRRYETTPESLDSIALDFSSNRSTLRNIAKREKWQRYVPPPRGLSPVAKLLAEVEKLETAALSLPPRSGGEGRFGERQRDEAGWGDSRAQVRAPQGDGETLPPTPNPSPPLVSLAGGGEQENIERLTRIVMAHADEFEALRRNGKLTAKDHLATARAISILTDAFNRLQRQRAGLPGSIHDDVAAAEMPTDLDAFRDQLARRIDAFIASRANAGTGGGDDAAPTDVAS